MEASEKETVQSDSKTIAIRRKRINRLKKIIIGSILTAILVPTVTSVILAIQVFSLKGKLRETEATCDTLLKAMADGSFHLGDEALPIEETTEEEIVLDTEAVEEVSTRKVYLTFDDGPSENTEEILKVLEQYNVKATFFVTGEAADSHPELYQAIVDGGHTLGMHSYSHKYNEIYRSEEDFGSDLLKLQAFLEETTKVSPKFYRFPGGSSNTVSEQPMTVFCDYLTDNAITYFDWNISSKDATNPMRTKDEIVWNCVAGLENFSTAVILMHDAANKDSTVEALPEVIEQILAMENTEILPITEDTVVIHH